MSIEQYPRDISLEARMRSKLISDDDLARIKSADVRRVRFCDNGGLADHMAAVSAVVEAVVTSDGSVGKTVELFDAVGWRHQLFLRRANGVVFGDVVLHVGCRCKEVS